MVRVLLFSVGIVIGLVAETILWNGPNLYALVDGWHSAAFTRMVGVGVIVEGALSASGAALCLGRALCPLASAPTQGGTVVPAPTPAPVGGGPVLPICGLLFLLAAVGPFGQALKASDTLAVMDSEPGNWGPEIVDDYRRQTWTAWTLCILWLVVGGALMGSPLFLEPRVWRFGWRMNGTGCGIAVGGFLLSSLGALVCFVNALGMEGASADVNFAGQLGVLGGAVVAVTGSIVAVLGRPKP